VLPHLPNHREAINLLLQQFSRSGTPGGKAALFSGASAPGGLPGERQVLNVIQGDAVPQKFIPKLIKLYPDGRFPFDRLVKFYDFTKINRAIADSKHGTTIKPVLLISH